MTDELLASVKYWAQTDNAVDPSTVLKLVARLEAAEAALGALHRYHQIDSWDDLVRNERRKMTIDEIRKLILAAPMVNAFESDDVHMPYHLVSNLLAVAEATSSYFGKSADRSFGAGAVLDALDALEQDK